MTNSNSMHLNNFRNCNTIYLKLRCKPFAQIYPLKYIQ